MPELRIDPLTGLRTIVASDRVRRPGGGWRIPAPTRPDPESDPFLEGHEDRTPPEVFALRPNGGSADGPGWTVRVVPNLYPSLASADDGLGSISHLELAKNVRDMVTNCLWTEYELLCNRGVGVALGDQRQKLALALC